MRIFPDANILVAAFMWEEGLCGRILHHLLTQAQDTLIVSDWVWEETVNTLHITFDVPLTRIATYKALVFQNVKTVRQPTPLALAPYTVSDFDDRVVLSCALVANADVLITGDQALLNVAKTLEEAENLRILHPKNFLLFKGL